VSVEIIKEFARGELESLYLPAKTVYLLLLSRKCCQCRLSFHVLSSPSVSTIIDAVCGDSKNAIPQESAMPIPQVRQYRPSDTLLEIHLESIKLLLVEIIG
jgi:hypothetical protein